MNENITYYYKDIEITQEQFYLLFNNPIARRTSMPEPTDFPIKIDDIPNELLPALAHNIQKIQKKMFPDLPVKYIPIAPGTEKAAIQLVLSAISQLPTTAPTILPCSVGFGNKQFWLTFTMK